MIICTTYTLPYTCTDGSADMDVFRYIQYLIVHIAVAVHRTQRKYIKRFSMILYHHTEANSGIVCAVKICSDDVSMSIQRRDAASTKTRHRPKAVRSPGMFTSPEYPSLKFHSILSLFIFLFKIFSA